MRSNRKSKFPEWDGFGNKFEWVLEQVKRMREERNGNTDRTRVVPDLRLYVYGRLASQPALPLQDRPPGTSMAPSTTASVVRINAKHK